jgi:hypothetical protein
MISLLLLKVPYSILMDTIGDEPADDILADFILPEKWVPPQEAMHVSQKKCDSGFMVVGGMF